MSEGHFCGPGCPECGEDHGCICGNDCLAPPTELEMAARGYVRTEREYRFDDSCCGKCPMGTTCYVDQMTGA